MQQQAEISVWDVPSLSPEHTLRLHKVFSIVLEKGEKEGERAKGGRETGRQEERY